MYRRSEESKEYYKKLFEEHSSDTPNDVRGENENCTNDE